jgi:integrase
MAFIKSRKTSKGITYHLVDIVNGKEKASKIHARTMREANEYLYKYLGDRADGRPNSLLIQQTTFGDFVQNIFLEVTKHTKKELTYRRDMSHLKPLMAEWKNTNLNQIGTAEIQLAHSKWLREGSVIKEKPLSNKTVNNRTKVLSSVLRMAWKRKLIFQMPEIPNLKVDKLPPRYYSEKETEFILSNVRPFVRDFVIILLHTGLRLGELRNLKWEHIDFKHKNLTVMESKSHKFRVIPLNRILEDHLLKLKSKANNRQIFIFEGRPGEPFNDFYKAYIRELKRIMVKGTLHMWRHTFASRLVQRGESLYVVQKLLGHASIKTTEIYAHLRIDDLESAVRVLESDGTVTEPKQILKFKSA